MPYRVNPDNPLCVQVERSTEWQTLKCHETPSKAQTHLAALNLNTHLSEKSITYNGVTVTASGRRTSTRTDKKYMRTVTRGDTERTVHYGDPDMPMRRTNKDARANFNSRHNCDGKKDPFSAGFWACYDWNNVSEVVMQERFYSEMISAFSGNYPTIANRADFMPDGGDDNPVYIILPLGEAGNRSRNERVYSERFYQNMVTKINAQEVPVFGIVGHRDPERIQYETHHKVMEWVGATYDEMTGMAWGKAYIYPEQEVIRAQVLRAKARRLQVATSISGSGYVDPESGEFVEIDELSIDYVEPEFAGVRAAVATPEIVAEKTKGENPMSNEKIVELSEKLTTAQTNIGELRAQITEQKSKLSALQTEYARVSELLGKPENLLEAVQDLHAERKQLSRQLMGLSARTLIDEKIQSNAGRQMLADAIGMDYDNPTAQTLQYDSIEAVRERVERMIERPYFQELVRDAVSAHAGGAVRVGESASPAPAGTWQRKVSELAKTTNEDIANARLKTGI